MSIDWYNSHCVLIITQRELMRNHNVDGSGTSNEIHFLFIYLSYYACKMRSNRPNRLTYVAPKSNLLRIKCFVLGISIPFKWEFYNKLQIHYTKNLNPGRFELGTTLSWRIRSIMLEWICYQRFVKITRKETTIRRQITPPMQLQNRSFQFDN